MGQERHICVSQHPLTGEEEPPLKGQMSSALPLELGKHYKRIPVLTLCHSSYFYVIKAKESRKTPNEIQ